MKKDLRKAMKRILALVLCAAMLLPMAVVPVHATEGDTATEPVQVVTETIPEQTVEPTETPTEEPIEEPTEEATEAPSEEPTEETTEEATEAPIEEPTEEPVEEPTEAPAEDPTEVIIEAETEEEGFELSAGALIQISDEISIPGYPGGKTSKVLAYDGGNGVSNKGEKSYIAIVTGTNSSQFISYKSDLAKAGYKRVKGTEKEVASRYANDPNRFASYLSPDGSYKLYTYHLPYYGEARIIVDTQADTVEGYRYEPQKGVSVEPKLVMWGLSTSPSGYHIDTSVEGGNTGRENNGVLLIIRMKDNSLFFYDGGILAQMSDAESAELLAFCRELTGAKVGEKMVINTWFVSHAHDDHFQAFGRFINIHHNHFDLKNVVYNIDLERGNVTDLGGTGTTPASKDLREALDVIREHYKDVRYYKPHTGETFDVAGIKFDVLYTHEDRLVPDTSRKLSFETDIVSPTNSVDIADEGGTYRGGLYKSNGYSDFNDTSTVLRVNFENGVDSILYADLNLAESILKNVYPASELKTDIMLVPHHLFDDHKDLAAAADARVYLCAQNKVAVYGADNDYTTANAVDKSCRDSLRSNFAAMKDTLTGMGRTEGVDYDIFWGGSETTVIDIDELGRILGYTPATRAVTTGSYYTTEPANSFEFSNNWGITTPASAEYQSVVTSTEDNLAMEDAVDNAVKVSTPQIVFTPHGDTYFVQEGRYLLMNVAYGHIMSFDATAAPEVAPGEQHGTSFTGSIKKNADGNSENTYYLDSNGNVILDHSDRHFAIWNLRQYHQATGGSTLANGVNLVASVNKTFGGSAQFEGVELQKRTNAHDSYWYSHYFDENTVAGSDFQLRYFCFKSDSTAFKNHYRNSLQTTKNDVYGDQSGSRVKFILDSLGDGTYLLYFKESNTDYRVVTCDANGTWDVIRYQGSNAVANIKNDLPKHRIRLYDYKETDANKSVAFCGYQRYLVNLDAAVNSILTDISNNITVFDTDHKNQHIPYNGSEVTVTNIGGTQYAVGTKAGYYWLDGSEVNTTKVGEYPVAIKYHNDDGSDTTIGEVKVIVDGNYKSISNKSGTVSKNAGMTTVVKVISGEEFTNATFKYQGNTIDIAVGMLTDANGNPVDTSVPGTYSGLTLTYKGVVICNDFTLTVAESNLTLDYPIYPEEGSVKVDKNGKELTDFSKTGTAQIELSATAKPLDKGVDLIVIMDLSSSMRYHVHNSEYACGPKYNTNGTRNTNIAKENGQDNLQYAYSDNYWKNTRMYALEEALKEMVNTLSSSKSDVRIAMADFGDLDHYEFQDAVLDDTIGNPAGSKPYWDADLNGTGMLEYEMSNHVNFVLGKDDISTYKGLSQPYWLDQTKHNDDYKLNTNGTIRDYTGKKLPKIYTGSGSLNSEAFQKVSELNMSTIIEDMRVMNGKRLGTNYDIGLETAYRLAYARQQANIAAGEDREIVCIFMSDGAAMQYNYLSGRSQTEAWSQCIIGETDEILDEQNNKDKYVITSDYGDTTVKQNPLLKEMLQKLAGLLRPYDGSVGSRSSLIMPGDGTKYYPGYTGSSTDFFEQMKSVGVECDWELLWQIAWKNYTVAETNTGYYNALNIPSLNIAQTITKTETNGTVTAIFADKTMEAVVNSLRKPSGTHKYQTLSPYYYFYNDEGKNWWAEALKGDSDKLYPVISKFAFHDSTEWGTAASAEFYHGDVRNNFDGATTSGLALKGQDYIAGFRGLDIDLYTIGFSLGTENRIDYTEAAKVLENIASGPAYHYTAASGETLTAALKSITGSMSVAATGAYFVDTMGPEFDLSTEKTVNGHDVNANPSIRVLEYTLAPIKDEDDNITGYERAKDTDGNYIYTVRETITFEAGTFGAASNTLIYEPKGTKVAYSDQVFSLDANGVKTYTDIWDDTTGVITGKFVRYNTNTSGDVKIDLTGDGVGDYDLPAETFFWTIGMIGETEIVLEYQVYLTDSMKGRDAGVYDTNTRAVLNYVNHLGNNCHKDTVTPAFPWPNAVVGYGFYLVDANGNPLNKNGDTCSFTDSVKLGDIEYISMELNGDSETIVASDKLTGTLNEHYDLYDPETGYTITISSSSDGSFWEITTGDGTKYTTYVTNYGGAPTTKDSEDLTGDVAYDRTVVWFALVATPDLEPDSVVIDFGLPVHIDVLSNDTGISNATLIGTHKGAKLPDNGLAEQASGYSTDEVAGSYGKIKKLTDSDKLQYIVNDMQMKAEDVFTYGVKDGSLNRYYYSTVTVIPATTIYYEDSFVSYSMWNVKDDSENTQVEWSTEGTVSSATQAEDRPGAGLSSIDADNIYGYDGAYTACSQYSLGSARKATVNMDVYAEAQFTFWGTGFDVISMTTSTTGTILVDVYKADDFDEKNYSAKRVRSSMVDTYYGYKWDGSSWVVDETATGALYQVPVMKVENLDYGRYTAVITCAYNDNVDHKVDSSNSYDFYLDAIRIYDPANDGATSDTVKDAYEKDNEGWPEYFELRNLLITRETFDSIDKAGDEVSGIVFIDNTEDKDKDIANSIVDYTNFGPNNELYLAPDQAVAFKLNVPNPSDTCKVAGIHLAMKSVGETAKVKVYDAADAERISATPEAISTATDMYYNITDLNGKTVVIKNTGESSDAILSVTNVKVTYTDAHAAYSDNTYFTIDGDAASAAVLSLRRPNWNKPDDIPEETTPEETVPETTVPEETVPETTEPEETVPETTVPEETEPAPEAFEPKRFSVHLSDSSVKVDSQVVVTVTTGSDVRKIAVNGQTVTGYSGSWFSGTRTWRVRITADTVGELPIEVTAYNVQGVASEPVRRSVEVTENYTSIMDLVEDMMVGIIRMLMGKR